MVDSVLARDELDAEGLDAREEEVPAGTRDDEDDVRPDPEDVAGGGKQAQPPGVSQQDEIGVRLEAALARQPLRIGRLVGFGRGHGYRDLRVRVEERLA